MDEVEVQDGCILIYNKSEVIRLFIRKMAYSVWDIPPINSPKKDEKHVAPFPEELPKRLILLFTFKNEVGLEIPVFVYRFLYDISHPKSNPIERESKKFDFKFSYFGHQFIYPECVAHALLFIISRLEGQTMDEYDTNPGNNDAGIHACKSQVLFRPNDIIVGGKLLRRKLKKMKK